MSSERSKDALRPLKCNERMYNDFKLKCKVYPFRRKNNENPSVEESQKEDLCIVIPLKGGEKNVGPTGQPGQALTQDFLRAIQDEYATRFLEIMKIEPTMRNKIQILQQKPLTNCEITPSWNSSGWLADFVQIYPNRTKKRTFENSRDSFVKQNRSQNQEKDEGKILDFMNNMTDVQNNDEDPKETLRANLERNQELKRKRSALMRANEEALLEKTREENQELKRPFELNLDPDYWRHKFLYPFALNPQPLRLDGDRKQKPQEVIEEKKRQKMMADEGTINTQKFRFPISQVKKPQEFLPEIQRPITMTIDDIKQDMNNYAKNFPKEIIPHITENNEINDLIHNYKLSNPVSPKVTSPQTKTIPEYETPKTSNGVDHNNQAQKAQEFTDSMTGMQSSRLKTTRGVPSLDEATIQIAQREIQEMSTCKLIGLIAHLAYWNVFGHFNSLPLDAYHMKQLFISIQTIRTQLDLKYHSKKIYHTFLMPMLMLAIRMSIELIFKNSFPKFFSVKTHEVIAMKQINDLITQLLDSNLFYSRFSFFESGRDAINIKYQFAKSSDTQSPQQKFFRRSALVEQLFPNPSEGKVRALFGTGQQQVMTKTAAILERLKTTNIQDKLEPHSARLSTGDMRDPFAKKILLSPQTAASPRINQFEPGSIKKRNLPALSNPYIELYGETSDKKQKKEEEDNVLKLINKVQMFQIAVQKINKQCQVRKEEPVFSMAKGGYNTSKNNFIKYFEEDD